MNIGLVKNKNILKLSDKILWAVFFVSAIFASTLKLFNIPGIGEVFLFRILVIFFFIISFYHASKRTKLQRYTAYLFLGFILYGTLSLLWCTSKTIAIKSLINYVVVFMLSMTLISFFNSAKGLNYSLRCCSAILILLQIWGIYESLTGKFFFPVDEVWLYERNGIGLWSPLTVFDNTNDFIFALVGYSPFFFISVKQLKRKGFVLKHILMGFYVIITGYLAYAGKCRMGLIMIVFVLFGYLYLGKYHNILKPIMFIGVLFLIFTLPYWIDIVRSESRWEIWGDALKSARHYLFLGVGIGNSIVEIPGVMYTGVLINPHFWFLEIFVEFGFIIFGLMLAWYIYIVIQAAKLLRRHNHSFRLKSVIIFMISFVFLSMMSSTIAFSNMFYIFICIVIGIINEYRRKESQIKIQENEKRKEKQL